MPKRINIRLVIIIILLVISYFTYVRNYEQPAALFWDENYHIASAQKYLNQIFFMEPHPPLAKILIALGEKLINANQFDNQFINTDYAKNIPTNFSFAGYRFFPVILAWLTTPLLFTILFKLTKNNFYAAILTCLYIFDNALIVHSRSAMLDSTLVFFICLNILLFLLVSEWKNKPLHFIYGSIAWGISLGLAVTTKLTGLILVLLVPFLIFQLIPQWYKSFILIILYALGFLISFIAVWQVHFTLAVNINSSLNNRGYYEASKNYKQILAEKNNYSLLAFPIMFRDSTKYVSVYQKGVPKLNLCKQEENGSPPLFWLVGARSINYRWETPDSQSYKYLYLQVNPIVWLISLSGVILASCLWLASWLLPLAKPLQNRFFLTTFLALYWGYMIAIIKIDRVMYLYHYFPPLLFSFCLFALVFREIKQVSILKLNGFTKKIILSILLAAIFISYRFYSPLTYYQPLTDEQFKQRIILPIWNLKCVNCESDDGIVKPHKV